MNDELRNIAWQCLPRETREKIRMIFNMPSKCGYPDSIRRCLLDIYGNILTSDTEPAELLFVERRKVSDLLQWANECTDDTEEAYIVKNTIESLFGDKCLPDKEESVQAEPRFKVGDKVRIKPNAKDFHNGYENGYAWLPIRDKYVGKVYRIKEIWDRTNDYILDFPELISWAAIDLEPYTEPKPKFKIGDKVRTIKDGLIWHVAGFTDEYIILGGEKGCIKEFSDFIQYDKSYKAYRFTKFQYVKSYTESETKDTEEKELNLCELLKVGDSVYSPTFGERIIGKVMPDRLCDSSFICYKSGKIYEKGEVIVYPSRTLYEKYPLDAKAAWDEWASERKPKYILQAEIRLISKDGKNIEDYENVEVEVSDIDLTQAAEGIREYLKSFNEKNLQ